MSEPAVLITGGTSGIGLATANLLHQRGFAVAVTGRSRAGVDRARAELPHDVLVLQADSASTSDTAAVVEQVRTRFGGLTALFLNAGANKQANIGEVDAATYDEVFAVNTRGAFFTLQNALPILRDGASVVVTVGTGVLHGLVGASVVAGSRGALLAMVPSLARELAPRRIRVNAVSPGAVDTPMWRDRGTPEEIAPLMSAVAATIPLARFGTADDIAETVAFLVSDASSYITGQNLVVAGGP